MPELLDDDPDAVVKEMIGLEVDRVDGVHGPASRIPFLVMKSLEDPETAAALAEAAAGPVAKAKYDTEQLRQMLSEGHAIANAAGEPSFPVGDTADLRKAVHAVGLGDIDHDKIRRYLIRRADALDARSLIPADWAADGALKETHVTKSEDPTDLDVETVSDGPAGSDQPTDAPGDPSTPGSPAWEAIDAARARQAINMVIALRRVIATAAARENQEAASGDADDDDAENAFQLSQVHEALECVLDVLAPFALGEQAEAEDPDSDDRVTKSGRVLSGLNETLIRQAADNLTRVLSTLPAAEPEMVAKSDSKDAEPLMAVFSQGGRLLGAVSASALVPLQVDDSADDDADEETEADTGTEPAPAPGDQAAAAVPAVPVAPAATVDEPVAKSQDVAEVVEAAVVKALTAEREQHDSVLKALSERLATLEAQPMPGGPLLGGAPNTAGTPFLRGQDLGAAGSEIETVRKAMEAETDPVRQADLRRQLTFLAMKGAYSS